MTVNDMLELSERGPKQARNGSSRVTGPHAIEISPAKPQRPNAENSIAEYGSLFLRAKNQRVMRTKAAMACSHVYP